ncbi:MAG: 5' nucleotidase, NT5C type [Clostridia bacterium]
MKIGIDIDGVLTDEDKFMYDYGTKFCKERQLPMVIKPNQMEEAIFGWDEEISEQFWNTYLVEYVTRYPARHFAAEVIQKLKEKHEIYIVTARNEQGLPKEFYGKMKLLTEKWLETQNIHYDDILYTKRGKKLTDCVEKGIQIMVEDDPMNIEQLQEEIMVLCYDCQYNHNIEKRNITRVYSWYDILKTIETIEKKS